MTKALQEAGKGAAEQADAIGCGWSTQGGGMPDAATVNQALRELVQEAEAATGEARVGKIRSMAAWALFAAGLEAQRNADLRAVSVTYNVQSAIVPAADVVRGKLI